MATSATHGAGRLPPSSPLNTDRSIFDIPSDLDFETESGRGEFGKIFGRLNDRLREVKQIVEEKFCPVSQLPREECADCAIQKQGHRHEEFVYELEVLEQKMAALTKFRDLNSERG